MPRNLHVLLFMSALSGAIPGQAYQANCIWCAVLLVLPPLGQADISPFGKNLSQAETPAPAPCPKGRRSTLLHDPVITVALPPFRLIRLFLFISPARFFRYSSSINARSQNHHMIAPVIQHQNQHSQYGDKRYNRKYYHCLYRLFRGD